MVLDDNLRRTETWVRHTAAVSALRRVVDLVGVDNVLPVKGIVTARTYYADLADRPIADVDLRVRGDAEIDRIAAHAIAEGTLKYRSRAYGNVVLSIEGVEVDVDRHVGPPGLSGLAPAAMLARAAIGTDLFGFPCKIPEVHDHALLLAVTLFKDHLVHAKPAAVDDARRIVEDATFEPARFAALASSTRSRTLGWLVADWLAPESPRWAHVRDAIGRRPPRRAYTRIYRWLQATMPLSLTTRLFARTASDAQWMRVRALFGAARFDLEVRRARRN